MTVRITDVEAITGAARPAVAIAVALIGAVVASACGAATTSGGVVAPEPLPIDEGDGWELVWADEFDGDTIDRTNWTFDIGGWGWGNGEAQHYTDRTGNARVEHGLLVIEARQERFEDSYYTSARLKTQGLQEFRYGRIEARLKVPAGAGVWPAFWMLGSGFEEGSDDPARNWPAVGEIDVMEYIGRQPDLVMGTVHGPGYSGALGLTTWNRQDHDIADDFHTYAVEWEPDGIRWFYDGHLPGPIALDLEFPLFLHVDHVRVYQRTEP